MSDTRPRSLTKIIEVCEEEWGVLDGIRLGCLEEPSTIEDLAERLQVMSDLTKDLAIHVRQASPED